MAQITSYASDSPSLPGPGSPAHSSPGSRSSSPNPNNGRAVRKVASHNLLASLMQPGRARSGSSASQPEALTSLQTEGSGPSSGRTTPEQRRRQGKAAATSLLANDARYKKYATQVDRCLQLFDSVNEWADFISFLSRLLKTLQSVGNTYSEIPRKLVLSKRLSQCLNPALPAGVHQRALDVYAHVFSVIGVEGLKRDLLIWSSGLFPFFQFATTAVRPMLLRLYERYYLELGEDLRPAVKAITIAVLPGMEEETGDFFEPVLSLLTRISDAVTSSFFTSNLFLILITSPSTRLSALNYLAKRMPKPPDPAEVKDPGLLIRGVAAVLEDENVLVRRTGLDLLLRIFPLSGDILKDASSGDRKKLVLAAASVTLQRELSLIRRVHTWLLGPNEGSEAQIAFLRQHGLDLLVDSLLPGMNDSRLGTSSDAHRPYKMFISLLDKWEVGAPLSERLALPALSSLRIAFEQSKDLAAKEDFLATATGLYEAVEPLIVWRSLWQAFASANESEQAGGLDVAEWLLRNIRMNDEDTVAVQLPVTLQGLLRLETTHHSQQRVARLAQLILRNIPQRLWAGCAERPSDRGMVATRLYDPRGPAKGFSLSEVQTVALPDVVHTVFEKLAVIKISSGADEQHLLNTVLSATTLLGAQSAPLSSLDSSIWTSTIVSVSPTLTRFDLIDSTVDLLLAAHRSDLVTPPFNITTGGNTSELLSSLFRFLAPRYAQHHLQAVNQVWALNDFAEPHVLENVIAHCIRDKFARPIEGLKKFGTLWRYTDDAVLPGETFLVPLLLVLAMYKEDDPSRQSAAATWLRLHMRSYFRILDPILARLLEPIIPHAAFEVTKLPDLASFRYLVDSLCSLFDFGGQAMFHLCQTTSLDRSSHPEIASFLLQNPQYEGASYTEIVSEIMVVLLNQQPQHPKDTLLALHLHFSVIDFLRLFVALGELSAAGLDRIYSAVIMRLGDATARGQLTIQPKLLRLLHELLTYSRGPVNMAHRRSTSLSEKSRGSISNVIASTLQRDTALLQVVMTGLTSFGSRPVLQHWIDLVVSLTQPWRSKTALLASLCETVAAQLRAVMLDLQRIYGESEVGETASALSDAEPRMLLIAMESLITAILPTPAVRKTEDSKTPTEGGSIFGIMSNVFTVEAPDAPQSTSELDRSLKDAVTALLVVWSVVESNALENDDPRQSSQAHVFRTLRISVHKILERLYKSTPTRILATCAAIWVDRPTDVKEQAIFGCIDTLAPSAQRVIETTVQALQTRQSAIGGSNVSEIQLGTLAFIEAYIRQLEAPIAIQVWQPMFAYGKDLLQQASSSTGRVQLFSALRCFTALTQIVASTSALEDRRLRRDVQETYVKLLDLVAASARSAEAISEWAKSAPNTPVLGRELTTPSVLIDTPLFLATEVVPHLKTLLIDTDRVITVCTNMFAHVITPSIRQLRFDQSTLQLALSLGRTAPSSKPWRIQIGDVFNDSRFFGAAASDPQTWKSIISTWMDGDKERFNELLGRITATSSPANIFASREQEMITRCLNIRRLSLVVYAGEVDHYLTHLPIIQERLVDTLRSSSVTPRVHAEVYLCLRVIMCRISAQHLNNFWPVILSELLRIFEDIMDEPPEDGSEDLPLILAACKFLDLLLVIQTEDFQIHQWMFVTDTTDAVLPPEDHLPEAIMDRLSELLSEHLHLSSDTQHPSYPSLDIPDSPASFAMRRPRLAHVHELKSLRQLQPFFARSSIDTYEGVFSNTGVDWEAAEDNMDAEIFNRD